MPHAGVAGFFMGRLLVNSRKGANKMLKHIWMIPLIAAIAVLKFPTSSFAISAAESHESAGAHSSVRQGFVLLIYHFNVQEIVTMLPDYMEPTHRQILQDRLQMHEFLPENPVYVRYEHHDLETTYMGLAVPEEGRARLVGSIDYQAWRAGRHSPYRCPCGRAEGCSRAYIRRRGQEPRG